MPYSMSCKMLANMKSMLSGYLLNHSPNLIEHHSWLAYRNGIIQRLLSHLHYLLLYGLYWLTVENSEVVVSVMAVEVSCDVDVDLISPLEWTSGGYTVHYAFIH